MYMKRGFVISLLSLCCCMFSGFAADTLDQARRITGHYAQNSSISRISVKEWDPMSEEARKFMSHMDAQPSRIFRAIDKNKEQLPEVIATVEDLEDIVLDMHYTLEPSRRIEISPALSSKDVEEMFKKVNTLYYLNASLYRKESKTFLQVYYWTDARVFAAFRNPELEKDLTQKERDLLDVCGQWISSNIEVGMPNMLKIRKIHDALVDNSKYTPGYHDTYNIVVNGKGVCSAYTSATQLLLHMVKIDCRSVLSTPRMNHIWNIIDVNGDWYYTDVTWDDPTTQDGKDVKVYSYYFLTKAEIEMTHEWEEQEKYPVSPEINQLGIFKRQAHREAQNNVDEDDELTYPRERESVFDSILEMRRNEIEERGTQIEETVAPVTSSADAVTKMATGTLKKLPAPKQKKKQEKAEYKPINTLDDLYENLKLCQKHLDGPLLEFPVQNTCGCFLQQLRAADYHLYIKNWNWRYDSGKAILYLDIVHWPHVRLLRAHEDDSLVSKLTSEERSALNVCVKMADTYGTIWKTDRLKIRDIYSRVIQDLNWQPGPSGAVTALDTRKSGSLGFSEVLHIVLTMMDIPSQLVHGRTDKRVHAWLVIQRKSRKWYHADSALDAEEGKRHESSFKYMLRCDDEVFDNHVWDLKEVPPTPIKNRERAAKQGLIKSEPQQLKLPVI